MAKPNKKGDTLESQLGRPKKGALSTYPQELRDLIFKIRDNHEGWGANTILVELVEEHGYQKDELPGLDAVNRFIKQKGLVKERIPSGKMPVERCKDKVKHFHDLWEMDAEGAVEGLSNQKKLYLRLQLFKIEKYYGYGIKVQSFRFISFTFY